WVQLSWHIRPVRRPSTRSVQDRGFFAVAGRRARSSNRLPGSSQGRTVPAPAIFWPLLLVFPREIVGSFQIVHFRKTPRRSSAALLSPSERPAACTSKPHAI